MATKTRSSAVPSRHAAHRDSFAHSVKNEMCLKMPQGAEARAEIAAMTLTAADLSAGGSVKYTTENLAVARRIVRHVREGLGLAADVEVAHGMRGGRTYRVRVRDGGALLAALGLRLDGGCDLAVDGLGRSERAAVIRGAFLAGGSISNPSKNYHAELVVESERFAGTLLGLLGEFGICANIFTRKERFVLYLNEGDSIVALLALTGAHSSILKLENVRIFKETRNNVNRAVNCETANINKTVNAALNQIHSIRTIDDMLGLAALPMSLRETAQLRLDHPEATLQELCELSGTSKSCMNHRLRKINSIAQMLSEEVASK